jgi:hypothetical protein
MVWFILVDKLPMKPMKLKPLNFGRELTTSKGKQPVKVEHIDPIM